MGGTGSAVSSVKICGCSHISFHWSLAIVALTCAGVMCSCGESSWKRWASTVGFMILDSLLSSTSIAVGSVVCGGVISGELIATRFLRGLGEKASVCVAVVSWSVMRIFVLSSCVSMGDGSVSVKVLSSVCCCEVVIGRGIVGSVVRRGSLVRVFGDGC